MLAFLYRLFCCHSNTKIAPEPKAPPPIQASPAALSRQSSNILPMYEGSTSQPSLLKKEALGIYAEEAAGEKRVIECLKKKESPRRSPGRLKRYPGIRDLNGDNP